MADGNPEVKTIEWEKNGEMVLNGHNSYLCLEFTPLKRADAGNYTCRATNTVGSSKTSMLFKVLCKYSVHLHVFGVWLDVHFQ